MNKVKIKDIVDIYNGSTPSTSVSENFDGHISWITPKDISDQKSKYINRGERNITEKGLNSIGGNLLPKGTILFSSRAPIGLMSICTKETSTNQGFKNMVCKKDKIDNEYLYYLLKTQISKIQELGTGTTFKEVSKSTIESFELYIEENVPTQQKIAAVLSALDDKIEVNNKINAELEAMAKTLYDYWFVQFEFPFTNESHPELVSGSHPKGYKSAGGKMVYNSTLKREIPEGWEVKNLKDIAKTGSGGTPKSTVKEFYDNGTIPWINSGELNNPFIVSTDNLISNLGMSNSSAKLFPANSILMAMYGATAGKTSIISFAATTNQAICAVMPNDKNKLYYTRFVLENLYQYLINLSTGSARDNLSQDKIKELNIIIPPDYILDRFSEIITPNFKKIESNLKQNQELAQLRDWLLPMLMNGQVTVE